MAATAAAAALAGLAAAGAAAREAAAVRPVRESRAAPAAQFPSRSTGTVACPSQWHRTSRMCVPGSARASSFGSFCTGRRDEPGSHRAGGGRRAPRTPAVALTTAWLAKGVEQSSLVCTAGRQLGGTGHARLISLSSELQLFATFRNRGSPRRSSPRVHSHSLTTLHALERGWV